jgi:hypothetical protein
MSHATGDMESFLGDRRHLGELREPIWAIRWAISGGHAAKARQHSFNGLAESPLDFHGVKAWCCRGPVSPCDRETGKTVDYES